MSNFADIILLGIFGAALHFLAYRAEITRWLWSRYPSPIDKLFACSACSGFWLGGALGLVARARGYSLLGFAPDDWLLLPAAAAVTMVLAPMLAALQVSALQELSGDAEDERH